MSTDSKPRVQAGVPTAGEWLAHNRREASIDLNVHPVTDDDIGLYVALRGDQLRAYNERFDRTANDDMGHVLDGILITYSEAETILGQHGVAGLHDYIDDIASTYAVPDPSFGEKPLGDDEERTATGRRMAQEEIRRTFVRNSIEAVHVESAIRDLAGDRQLEVYQLVNRLGGPEAVCNQARVANITDWRICGLCDDVSPRSTDGTCLICMSPKRPSRA